MLCTKRNRRPSAFQGGHGTAERRNIGDASLFARRCYLPRDPGIVDLHLLAGVVGARDQPARRKESETRFAFKPSTCAMSQRDLTLVRRLVLACCLRG